MKIEVRFSPRLKMYTVLLAGLVIETVLTYQEAVTAAVELKHAIGD